MQVILIIKITWCFAGLKQVTTTILNVQQGEFLIKLVTSIRVGEILIPTAHKQQPSTLEKCDPSCWVLAQSTLDHMEIVLSLRRADSEIMLQNLLEQKYEYKKCIIISLCSAMSSDPGVWTVRMKWDPVAMSCFHAALVTISLQQIIFQKIAIFDHVNAKTSQILQYLSPF